MPKLTLLLCACALLLSAVPCRADDVTAPTGEHVDAAEPTAAVEEAQPTPAPAAAVIEYPTAIAKWRTRSCACVYSRGSETRAKNVPITKDCATVCAPTNNDQPLCMTVTLLGTKGHPGKVDHVGFISKARVQCSENTILPPGYAMVSGAACKMSFMDQMRLATAAASPQIVDEAVTEQGLELVVVYKNITANDTQVATRLIGNSRRPNLGAVGFATPDIVVTSWSAVMAGEWSALYAVIKGTQPTAETLAFALTTFGADIPTSSNATDADSPSASLHTSHFYVGSKSPIATAAIAVRPMLEPHAHFHSLTSDLAKISFLTTEKILQATMPVGSKNQKVFFNGLGYQQPLSRLVMITPSSAGVEFGQPAQLHSTLARMAPNTKKPEVAVVDNTPTEQPEKATVNADNGPEL